MWKEAGDNLVGRPQARGRARLTLAIVYFFSLLLAVIQVPSQF